MRDPQRVNRYSYCLNDPINYLDPDGSDPISIWELLASMLPLFGPSTTVTVTANLPPSGSIYGQDLFELVVDPVAPGNVEAEAALIGSPPRFIHVRNPSKTGPQQDRIRKVLSWIRDNVDSQCANWLNSNAAAWGGLTGAINSLMGDPANPDSVAIGHGQFDIQSIAAFTNNNPSQTDLPVGYAMAINDNGSFFNSTYQAGGYQGGTNAAQVFILLHELGHLLNAPGFGSDFTSSSVGASNDALVNQNCSRTINGSFNIK